MISKFGFVNVAIDLCRQLIRVFSSQCSKMLGFRFSVLTKYEINFLHDYLLVGGQDGR